MKITLLGSIQLKLLVIGLCALFATGCSSSTSSYGAGAKSLKHSASNQGKPKRVASRQLKHDRSKFAGRRYWLDNQAGGTSPRTVGSIARGETQIARHPGSAKKRKSSNQTASLASPQPKAAKKRKKAKHVVRRSRYVCSPAGFGKKSTCFGKNG